MTLNKQGNNSHADLPACPKCNADDYGSTLSSFGRGMSLQYVCRSCGAQCVYRYCGPPGVLIYVLTPEVPGAWDGLNAFLNTAIPAYRKAAYRLNDEADPPKWEKVAEVPFPRPPAGLRVYVGGKDGWLRVEVVA